MANFNFSAHSLNLAYIALAQNEADKMFDLSGQKFLSAREGVRYKAYYDAKKIPTIGRGITYYEDGSRVKIGDTITPEREMALFNNTLQSYVANVNKKVTSNINQNQFNALVSLCYNIGIAAFNGSKLLKLVNQNPNNPAIRNAFLSWRYAGKKPILLSRRQMEANLYFS